MAAVVLLWALMGRESPRDGDGAEPPAATSLALDWPAADRAGAVVFLDGKKHAVPASGPVEFVVAPGRHRLTILRRGFDQIEEQVTIVAGEPFRYAPRFRQPEWLASMATLQQTDSLQRGPQADPAPASPPTSPAAKKAGPFDGWEQDFEAARQAAAEQKKNILVLFDGSDWCGWSMRLAERVLAKPGFRAEIEKDFVLVFVDFPRSPQGRQKVQDAARNERLAARFGVEGFPRVYLTDPDGLPFGRDGYQDTTVQGYVERMRTWLDVRRERDRLFAAIEQAAGEAKLTAAAEALELLQTLELTDHYSSRLQQWSALADRYDPANENGLNEVFFEAAWMARANELGRGGMQRLMQVAEELDDWTKQRQFKNADRAATMHLHAAFWMATLERYELASQYAARGQTYRPHDAAVRKGLERLQQSARASLERGAVGAGSGFVVAPGGYILTDYAAVEGARRLLVRFPEQAQGVPAELIASDSSHDLALLKVEEAMAKAAPPVAVADVPLGRGAKVAALGYPLNDTLAEGLELTEGMVSATQRQRRDGLMVLNCRVDLGNRGGPVCAANGCVAGMVTAKTRGGAEVASYGMALPSETILAFLRDHVPGYAPPASPEQTTLAWEEIDRRVSPSVVLILKVRGK